ncbi:hypothetical protein CWB73_19395 [Pseudoalteromonas phenolica]|uniref:DUF4430 domain-containing protein n=1 Tax=Pseudoalteromonas phenolica TaxID=161398 RepID=A0A5S3YPR5_9GAMM|nr:hypothetical protein [Pseudoalteromonas phenolica]TMP77583.1 hypothetical protein CWB73_19395 [Pseudoalteromonas phenolica]
MRKLLIVLLLLFTVQVGAQDFDIPIKISWKTQKGINIKEINSETSIEVINALNKDGKTVSFNLIVSAVVHDEVDIGIAHVGYWCVVNRIGGIEYLSVSEADIVSVSFNKVGTLDCLCDFNINVEWAYKPSQTDS